MTNPPFSLPFSLPFSPFSANKQVTRFPHGFCAAIRLVGLMVVMVISLFGAEPSEDGWRAWLRKPPEKRLVQLDEQSQAALKAGRQWLAAWCFMLDQPVGEERLSFIDRLAKLPAPGNAGTYLRLERARCWTMTKQIKEAIDVANQERQRKTNDPRLRFDAGLILADALDAGNRVDESNAVRREAEELAKRELYADAGVNPAQAQRQKLKTDPAELYALAENQRNAGKYTEAEKLYKSIMAAQRSDRLAPASMVGLGWCRIAQNDEAGGLLCWSGLLDAPIDSNQKNKNQPEAILLGALGPNSRGPFRGQAFLALIDHAVTKRTDPAEAQRWLDRLDDVFAHRKPADPSWDSVLRQARLHRIILHLAFDREAKAIEVAKALSADPAGDDAARIGGGNTYTPARGAMRLAQQLTAGEPLTPAQALTGGTPANNMRILMADAWAIMEQRDHARSLWKILLADQARLKSNQRAYVRMRLADADRDDGQFDFFRMGFTQILADQPNNPWAPRQRLCLAIDDIGRRSDLASGLRGFSDVLTRHPTSEQARTACWYTGMVHLFYGHWAQADQAWTELDQRWPNHPWRDVINQSYRPMLREAQRTGTWPEGLPRAAGAVKPAPTTKPRTP